MFTKEELFLLKELVEIEIGTIGELIEQSDELDARDLTAQLKILQELLPKLSQPK